MAYIGVMLAFAYLYFAFKVALEPRDAGSEIFILPFAPLFSGAIFGVTMITVFVWPFVLFGAHWPAMSFLIAVVAASALPVLLFYWKPAVKCIDKWYGLNKEYRTVFFS